MGKLDIKSTVVIDKEKLQRSLSSMNLIFKKCPPNQEVAIFIKSEDDNKLQMIANGSGVFIRTISSAESINGLNQWCLDGSMLSKFIRTMNKGKVTIQSDDENIYAKQGRTALKIPLMVTNSEIRSYSYNEMDRLSIDNSELIKGMRHVMHACTYASHNPSYSGIALDYYEDGRIHIVATDSKRMGFYSNQFGSTIESKIKYKSIIPKSVAEELIKVFEKDLNFQVYIHTTSESEDRAQSIVTFGFVSVDTEFYVQTISADFVEYIALLRHFESGAKYIVEKEGLLERINQVSTCSDKCSLSFNKDGVEVKSLEGRNSSEIVVHLDTPIDIEEPFKMGAMTKYLTEGLGSMSSRNIQFIYHGQGNPFGVVDYYADDPSTIRYGILVMPYVPYEAREEAKYKEEDSTEESDS